MKKDILPKELQKRIEAGEQIRIVDVRSPMEYAGGHVPGALNVPLGTIGKQIEGIGDNETLVMVCQGGVRSDMACHKIQGSHPKLYNLTGGTSAWRAAGLEVERSPKAPGSLDRQAHLVAGLLLATSFVLHKTVHPDWILLVLLPTFGLMLDALTGFCPMRVILNQLPWNKE
ncbi:MAG: rhodanese-like domain-containing protein [Fimbriimonadaceae bacterium]|jgi:rhodanese-related sulfurtransferase|nr:rhodanese-like domain-containing protein [Fimbriimonadaceae bacterium]